AGGAVQAMADGASAVVEFVAFRDRLLVPCGRVYRLLRLRLGLTGPGEPETCGYPSERMQKHAHFISQLGPAECVRDPSRTSPPKVSFDLIRSPLSELSRDRSTNRRGGARGPFQLDLIVARI